MATFIGEYTCKIDEKGRLLFPSGFKKQVPASSSDKFVVKKDIFEQCLVLYTMDEWEHQNKLLRSKINPYNKEHNMFLRAFYQGAAELEPDGNSRLLIPKRLLDAVGIDKEVVMAGQDGRIQIWAKDTYGQMEVGDADFAAMAEKIMGNSPFNDIA